MFTLPTPPLSILLTAAISTLPLDQLHTGTQHMRNQTLESLLCCGGKDGEERLVFPDREVTSGAHG